MKQVRITFGNLFEQRGMSIHELSLRANVRQAAISELVNGKRENINFRHIEQIADALHITDIREIITLVEVNE